MRSRGILRCALSVGELIALLETRDRNADVVIEVAKRLGKRIRVTLETPSGTREAKRGGIIPTEHSPMIVIETIGDTF